MSQGLGSSAVTSLWVAALLLAPAGAARAQDAVPAGGAAVAAEPAEVVDPRLEETRERVARGEELYESGDYDGALVEFQRAHDLLEGHPMQLFAVYNIGRCYERLFRYGEAMANYRRYLDLAGPDAEDRAAVEAKIELLEGLLGTVQIEVAIEGYEVWVDDHHVGSGLDELLVPGGNHVVELRAEGYQPARQEVTVPSRAEVTASFELERLAEEYRGLHPLYFWTSLGLGVATVAVGAVFGGLALAEHESVSEQAVDPVEGWLVTEDDLDGISRLALTADILYGVAGMFAVAATVLAFLTDWSSISGDGAADGEGGSALLVAPTMARGGAGLSLGGVF